MYLVTKRRGAKNGKTMKPKGCLPSAMNESPSVHHIRESHCSAYALFISLNKTFVECLAQIARLPSTIEVANHFRRQ